MTASGRFIHRTQKDNPSGYERNLSRVLITILARGIHDKAGIVAALNQTQVKPEHGGVWSEQVFVAEMERLGSYPNSVGAPLGAHPSGVIPVGSSSDVRPPPLKI